MNGLMDSQIYYVHNKCIYLFLSNKPDKMRSLAGAGGVAVGGGMGGGHLPVETPTTPQSISVSPDMSMGVMIPKSEGSPTSNTVLSGPSSAPTTSDHSLMV